MASLLNVVVVSFLLGAPFAQAHTKIVDTGPGPAGALPFSFAAGNDAGLIAIDAAPGAITTIGVGGVNEAPVVGDQTFVVAQNATQNDATLSADPTVVEVRTSASSDDAEERGSGSVSTWSSDLEMVQDRSTQTVGIRFNPHCPDDFVI